MGPKVKEEKTREKTQGFTFGPEEEPGEWRLHPLRKFFEEIPEVPVVLTNAQSQS